MGMEPHQSLSLATTGKNAAYANSVQCSLPSASKVATLQLQWKVFEKKNSSELNTCVIFLHHYCPNNAVQLHSDYVTLATTSDLEMTSVYRRVA